MSFLSAFTRASKETAEMQKTQGPAVPSPPSQGPQCAQSKPMPVGHASLAHPNHHEGATDLDLYRTFSPSDIGMWSWERPAGDSPGNSKGFWGKLFSSNSITGNSNK